jgi:hypothetical protein
VIGAIAALELGAPLAWPRRRGNIVCDVTLGDAMASWAQMGLPGVSALPRF